MSTHRASKRAAGPALRQFFFRPPRRHGEVDHGRLAWFNGTFWHEVHGREDGRSRTNIFVQMGLIALMAVYIGHATDADGQELATVYIILFAWYTYQWWAVHRIDDPIYRPITTRYLAGMLATIAAMGISIAVPNDARVAIWAGVVATWAVGGFAAVATTKVAGFAESLTHSMIERFGLFTIVVHDGTIMRRPLVSSLCDHGKTTTRFARLPQL